MNQVEALRTHIKQLNHAVATTMCRRTVFALREMLMEAETKLGQIDTGLPEGNLTTPPRETSAAASRTQPLNGRKDGSGFGH
jgi:hypothetical protein